MSNVDTMSDIAGMAYVHPVRDWSDLEFPGYAMSQAPFSGDHERAIAILKKSGCPEPTRPRFVNVRPESLDQINPWLTDPASACLFTEQAVALANPPRISEEGFVAGPTRSGRQCAASSFGSPVTGTATEFAFALGDYRAFDAKGCAALETGTLYEHRKTLPFGVIPPAVHSGAGAHFCPNYTPFGGL